ncbi:MAG: SOS response-associated peptidase family protein [Alphaproteobacteria bacterium]|nr:SOS response-associated peptidase family protein [Alphaproteobacteria bacterium]
MSDRPNRTPIWGKDFKPWSLPDIRMSWLWVYCVSPFCNHARAVPLAPWRIRWGEDDVEAAMAKRFFCGVCGRKGCTFHKPAMDHEGIETFPAGKELRMSGGRHPGESYEMAEARVTAAYRTKYPSGDALAEIHRGPSGPASMCGKFTAMASWSEVVAFSAPLTRDDVKESDNDRVITFRVMSNLPVIIWDKVAGQRRVVPMRWGWPDPKNWKIPKNIHARGETVDTTKLFAPAFLEGRRGIVIVRTFNEAPDVQGPTVQHTITPGELGAIGIAFLWQRFDLKDLPGTLNACVMVTMPANSLIATLPTDRMPAVLAEEDWSTWLGETGTAEDAKACLKTVEGVRWTMTKEERTATTKRKKPTASDPSGLL